MKSALNTAFFENQNGLIKQADGDIASMFQSALGGLAGSVFSSLKGAAEHPYDFLIHSLEEGAIITLVHRYFGFLGDAIYIGLQALGLDLGQVIGEVIQNLGSSLIHGAVSSLQVKQQVESVIPVVGHKVSSEAYRLEKLVKSGMAPMKQLEKRAQFLGTSLFLRQAFTWIISAILWGAGLLIAEDTAKQYFGISNYGGALGTSNTSAATSSQQMFKVKPSYVDKPFSKSEHSYGVAPNHQGVAGLLLYFANEIYDGLSDKRDAILQNQHFNDIVETIVDANNENASMNVTTIPSSFRSKKQIVDAFLPSVAEELKVSV